MKQARIIVNVKVGELEVERVLTEIDENVRMELQSLIKRAILACEGYTVDVGRYFELGREFLNKKISNWASLNRVPSKLEVKLPVSNIPDVIITVTISSQYD